MFYKAVVHVTQTYCLSGTAESKEVFREGLENMSVEDVRGTGWPCMASIDVDDVIEDESQRW
jgi:hypothetical protein